MTVNGHALALVQNHGYHPATTDEQKKKHADVRALFIVTAALLNEYLPPGRHRSLAMTELEKAEMWANRALALDGGPARLDEIDDETLEIAYEAVFRTQRALESRQDMLDRIHAALSGNLEA